MLGCLEMPFKPLFTAAKHSVNFSFVMEICHAFKKSTLHTFGVFTVFVDIVAPINGAIFVQQVTG